MKDKLRACARSAFMAGRHARCSREETGIWENQTLLLAPPLNLPPNMCIKTLAEGARMCAYTGHTDSQTNMYLPSKQHM